MDTNNSFSAESSNFSNQDIHDNQSSLSPDHPVATPPPTWPWGTGPFGAGGNPPVGYYPTVVPQFYTNYPLPPPPPIPSAAQDNFQTAPKVAIPRATITSSLSQRRRSARACEPCRQRKVKCDGVKPACRKCHEHGMECVYVDIKRVREQKQLGSLAKKVERYESLLRDLEPEVDASASKRIKKALNAFKPQPGDGSSDSDSSSSAGSLAAIDLVQEDLNRSERTVAAGFFGKSSEVAWIRKLEDEAERHSSGPDGADVAKEGSSQDTPILTMSYYLDDLDIPLSESTDPYALPSKELADQYFTAYMATVHPAFNVVRKETFTAQYKQFFSQPSTPTRRWLAILNMIFAIGCRYCRLIGSCRDGNVDDVEYLNRARKLSMSGEMLFDHADLQQIQVEILVAFYLLALGHVNRAFKISSMAFRSAVSLGINLHFVDDRTRYASKEARSRLWWSIYLLEQLLTSITGRVSGIGEGLSATPLPLPIDEEKLRSPAAASMVHEQSLRQTRLKLTLFQTEEENQSNAEWLATCVPSGSLFYHLLVDLSVITQSIMHNVYSIQGLRDPTSLVEQRLESYGRHMDAWLRKVPKAYQFTVSPDNDLLLVPRKAGHTREAVTLAIHYYSARITLSRPCMTHSRYPFPSFTHQRYRSRSSLRARLTLTCLVSACSLISTLPDEPDVVWLITMTPWWAILHFMMQATSVLLIALSSWPISTDGTPDPNMPTFNISTAVSHIKKAFRWLHHLSYTNKAARRALVVCETPLHRIAKNINLDISDVPDSGSLPPLEGEEDGGLVCNTIM